MAAMLGFGLLLLVCMVIAGGLVGLIPFFMARKRGYETMGGGCLMLCIAAPVVVFFGDVFDSSVRKLYDLVPPFMQSAFVGLALPSVPVCLICVIVILIRSKISRRKGE